MVHHLDTHYFMEVRPFYELAANDNISPLFLRGYQSLRQVPLQLTSRLESLKNQIRAILHRFHFIFHHDHTFHTNIDIDKIFVQIHLLYASFGNLFPHQ